MKKCPRCGNKNEFYVWPHIVQMWTADGSGELINCINDCVTTSHYPVNSDFWKCTCCGYKSIGSEFEVDEEEV